MRKLPFLCSPLLATLVVAPFLPAATLYVSPTGADTDPCTADTPCSLTTGASTAAAGDTVILRDGTYNSKLTVANSGTSSAWITFQADECATPIIQGDGLHDDDKPTGVGSETATYLRFVGLVSRGWNSGFSNGWTGSGTTTSNGNFEYKYCIGEGNGRTGFTFFSAAGIHIQNSISAHNGMSATHSWSSGITLYEAQGSDNKIEGNISFENVDEQNKTDGSGFIADESSNNATFINNIAFGNGGSCMRLTKSSGVKFINNTCFHNARDSRDTGPTNPGELYVTDTTSGTSTSFMNNVFISTGTGPGANAVYHQPTSGWTTNIAQNGGSTTMFTSPEGTNPDFTPVSGSSLAGKGTAGTGVPNNDVGFDPKCITKAKPAPIGNYSYSNYSWFAYSVDFDYIKSIGGVQKCFNPKTRSGTPDIGAYASGTVNKAPTCVKSTGGAPNTGGAAGTGGAQAAGGSGTTAAGGVAATGGITGASTTGTKAAGGATSDAGGSKATGGTTAAASATGGTSSAGGTKGIGTTAINTGGTKAAGGTTGANTTAAAAGGTTGTATTGSTAAGGTNANTTSTTSTNTIGGSNNVGGTTVIASNTSTKSTGTTAANAGGATGVGGASSTSGSVVSATNAGDAKDSGGCGCRVAGSHSSSAAAWGSLGLLGMLLMRTSLRRRNSK